MKKILFIIMLIFTLISCEKKDIYHTEINGNIIDQTTKSPIMDIQIKLYGGYGGIFGTGPSDLLAETTTDINGFFLINKEIELKDYSYFILGAYDEINSTDTNRVSYNYYFNYISGSENFYKTSTLDSIPNEINFLLRPSGVIEFNVNREMSNEYDTVIIESTYQIDTIFNYEEIQLYFPPNNKYMFDIYYVMDKEKCLYATEKIFIPNNRSRNSLLHYIIDN